MVVAESRSAATDLIRQRLAEAGADQVDEWHNKQDGEV